MSTGKGELHLYVKSKGAAEMYSWQNTPEGECWSAGANIGQYPIAYSSDMALGEREVAIVTRIQRFSDKYGYNLYVHDLALKSEARKVMFKRFVRTPMLLVNGRRIENIPVDDGRLLRLVKEALRG